MKTMITGLPRVTLRLYDIHPQWRIDIRSLSTMKCELVSQDVQIEGLLKEFQNKYQHMPLVQKDHQKKIA